MVNRKGNTYIVDIWAIGLLLMFSLACNRILEKLAPIGALLQRFEVNEVSEALVSRTFTAAFKLVYDLKETGHMFTNVLQALDRMIGMQA